MERHLAYAVRQTDCDTYAVNILRNDDRNEIWGKANNPKPPLGLETVSLNAPSGKTYDRFEEIRELNEKSAEFDRQMGQVRGPDGRIIRDSKKRQTDKEIQNVSENHSPAAHPFWLWIVIAGIAITGLFLWKLKCRRSVR